MHVVKMCTKPIDYCACVHSGKGSGRIGPFDSEPLRHGALIPSLLRLFERGGDLLDKPRFGFRIAINLLI
jgi:hypothetical protein